MFTASEGQLSQSEVARVFGVTVAMSGDSLVSKSSASGLHVVAVAMGMALGQRGF